MGRKYMYCLVCIISIICDGNLVESKTNVKYLGLIIDETLSGTAIALNIIAKNNHRLKFVYRNTRNFNMNTKKTTCNGVDSVSF